MKRGARIKAFAKNEEAMKKPSLKELSVPLLENAVTKYTAK